MENAPALEGLRDKWIVHTDIKSQIPMTKSEQLRKRRQNLFRTAV